LSVPHKPLGSAAETAMPVNMMLSKTWVHSSGVKSSLVVMTASPPVSVPTQPGNDDSVSAAASMAAAPRAFADRWPVPRMQLNITAHQGKGGAECLFDRLLCVSEEKRTASEENNAHTLALKRDKYEDMIEFLEVCADSIVQPPGSANKRRPANRRMLRDG
jgi:hypothetical protein